MASSSVEIQESEKATGSIDSTGSSDSINSEQISNAELANNGAGLSSSDKQVHLNKANGYVDAVLSSQVAKVSSNSPVPISGRKRHLS